MNRLGLIALLLTLQGSVLSLNMGKAIAKSSGSLSAETWYDVGMKHLKEENFLSAGDAFFQAYELAKEPALLYNAARSYEKGGNLKRAKRLFLLFTTKDGVKRARKEKAVVRIQAIDQLLLTPQEGRDIGVSASGTTSGKAWRWTAIGTGAALIVGSAVMMSIASSERDALAANLQLNDEGRTSGVSQFDAFQARDRANMLDTTAVVTGIAGAACLATGVVMWLQDEPSSVSLLPTRGGMFLSAGGMF